jgi:hypothetical protein
MHVVKDWLTVDEVAAIFRVRPTTVYLWHRQGHLPPLQRRPGYRAGVFPVEAVERLRAERPTAAKPQRLERDLAVELDTFEDLLWAADYVEPRRSSGRAL